MGIRYCDNLNDENTNMDKNIDINTLIDKLEKSPLFALTLCGKELAHSNFWAWLMELFDENGRHPFIDAFIPGFNTNYQYGYVAREKGNRDLTIYCKEKGEGKAFIIENKLKSIPTPDQLRRYQREYHDKKHPFSGGILTGIEDTMESKPDGWIFLSYNNISNRVKKINNEFQNPYQNIITDYCNDLDCIVSMLKAMSEKNRNRYIWEAPELKRVRMADIFLKIEAEKFGTYLRDRISQTAQLESKRWDKPIVELAFNRTKPTISIIYRSMDSSDNNENEIGRFGIQIEGLEFRYYGGPGYPKSPLMKGFPTNLKDRKNSEILKNTALFNAFSKCGWFYLYNPLEKKYRGEKTSMSKLFLAYYKHGEYCHAYQYFTIDGNNPKSITYDALWERIMKGLLEAKKIIDKEEIDF